MTTKRQAILIPAFVYLWLCDKEWEHVLMIFTKYGYWCPRGLVYDWAIPYVLHTHEEMDNRIGCVARC